MLMFGREMRLPIDAMRDAPPSNEPPDYPPFQKKQREILKGVHYRVEKNLEASLRCMPQAEVETVQSWQSGMVGGEGLSPVAAPEILSSLVGTLAGRQGCIGCHVQNTV